METDVSARGVVGLHSDTSPFDWAIVITTESPQYRVKLQAVYRCISWIARVQRKHST
jgi:hypothetical protein